jgi:hypothetical protein
MPADPKKIEELIRATYLVEGTVEQDPMTDRFYIRTQDQAGQPVNFDPQQALSTYKGQEVRLTIASFDTLAELGRLTEEAEAEAKKTAS